tara:strand:- start:24 stop:467 length:444 start_codon:yes stop_codon:yes gene_type:complete
MKTNLQKHISLSLAKEIASAVKEKGVELPESEKSYYFSKYQELSGWYNIDFTEDCLKYKKNSERYYHYDKNRHNIVVFAYDCAELGEILPNAMKYAVNTRKSIGVWSVELEKLDAMWNRLHLIQDISEVEARGKMLLYILKNDLYEK